MMITMRQRSQPSYHICSSCWWCLSGLHRIINCHTVLPVCLFCLFPGKRSKFQYKFTICSISDDFWSLLIFRWFTVFTEHWLCVLILKLIKNWSRLSPDSVFLVSVTCWYFLSFNAVCTVALPSSLAFLGKSLSSIVCHDFNCQALCNNLFWKVLFQ